MKEAVEIAKKSAVEMLGFDLPCISLEEVDRDTYNGHEVWSITIGHPRPGEAPIAKVLSGPGRDYKRFLIDSGSGLMIAMKIREVTAL